MADLSPGAGDLFKAYKALRKEGPIISRTLRAGGIITVGALINPTGPGLPHARRQRFEMSIDEQTAEDLANRPRLLEYQARDRARRAAQEARKRAGLPPVLLSANYPAPGADDP